jgi:hypothetical protein
LNTPNLPLPVYKFTGIDSKLFPPYLSTGE